MANDPNRFLPLKPQDFQILLLLLEGERHGYWLVKEIERATDGQIRLEAGNMYRAIRRLIRDGLVEETEARPAPESADERRRYYRITGLGGRVVEAETSRMRDLTRVAEQRLAHRRR